MDKKLLGNIVKIVLTTLLSVALAAYIGYHLVNSLDNSVETMTTAVVTQEVTIAQDGYLFREEQIVYAADGTFSYLVDDGRKVSKNTAIVDVYSGVESEEVRRQLNTLERKISLLKNSNTESGITYSDTTIIDSGISELYYTILQKIRNGETDFALQKTDDLISSLNRRQIVTGKRTDYNDRIAELEAQRDELVQRTGEVIATVKATESGYFFSDIDGFENLFSSKNVTYMTPSEFHTLITSTADMTLAQGADGTVAAGKLVTDFIWYLATEINLDQLRYYNEGQKFTVIFPYNSDKHIEMTLNKMLQETDSDSIVLLFETRVNPENFNYLRRQTIQIVREEATGYRVPISAVRINDGVQGVYVLKGYEVLFKQITPIMEIDGYFICKENDGTVADNDKLALNDAIITSGKNLYAGKIIS